MIAEVIPDYYDAVGTKVFRPFDRRKGLRPTFPLGRYVSHLLTVQCDSLEDVRRFLCDCKYVSDKELFGKDDYWQPPEEFEKRKRGDCEDFSFWTWRQLMNIGYDTRIVFGRHGRYNAGHAWVEFLRDDVWYLVEPQYRFLGKKFPRLTTLTYHPKFSVAWDGDKLSYFAHHDKSGRASFLFLVSLVPEYLRIWGLVWIGIVPRLPKVIWRLLRPAQH